MRKRNAKLLLAIVLATFISAQSYQNNTNNQSQKSILGKWSNEIVVPPNTEVYINIISFTGEETKGRFLDQNNHSGTWTLKGDSVTWIYEGVQELKNTFTGKLSGDGKSMQGINYGTWKGDEFKGSWSATKME